MSRQLEQHLEQRQARRAQGIVLAVECGLEDAVARGGAELTGFSVRYRPGECMLVLRGLLAGRAQVAFVGSEDLAGCLIKAVREAQGDRLRWREDQYAGPGPIAGDGGVT